jgi:acyl-CoA thioester hydrolase
MSLFSRVRCLTRLVSHTTHQSHRCRSIRSFSTTLRPSSVFTRYTSASNPVPSNVKDLLTRYGSHLTLPMSWGHQDAYQHMNNVSYASFVEMARINCMLSMCDYLDVDDPVAYAEKFMSGTGVGVILRKLNIDYKAPAKYPDLFTIGTALELMGTDRFRLRHRIVSHKTGLVVAEAEDVIVSYHFPTETKCDMPAEMYNAIQKYAAAHPGEPKKSISSK